MRQSFVILGLPGWIGYFIEACEVAGAIRLFIRPLRALAALGISVIMLDALYFHAMYTPMAQDVPALLLLLLCIYIFTQRRALLFQR